MKAIVCDKYGSPDVLELRDVDRPVPKDDEVLVRVRAAGLNPLRLAIPERIALPHVLGDGPAQATRDHDSW